VREKDEDALPPGILLGIVDLTGYDVLPCSRPHFSSVHDSFGALQVLTHRIYHENCTLCESTVTGGRCRTCVVMTMPPRKKTLQTESVVKKRIHLLSPSIGNSSTNPVTTVSISTIFTPCTHRHTHAHQLY